MILPKETLLDSEVRTLKQQKNYGPNSKKEGENASPEIQQLDFEFVLFASPLSIMITS